MARKIKFIEGTPISKLMSRKARSEIKKLFVPKVKKIKIKQELISEEFKRRNPKRQKKR